ncbi:MAG: aldo/keto reductase [Bacillota bacterium]|nr:aldo/keto reductase [Bacillota bacterium]
MKHPNDTYTLNNGEQIPVVGFGTWQVKDGEEAYQAVLHALKAGYRHIDTAQGYGNEESVGRALRDSGIARGEVFITSKLQNGVRGYEETQKAIDESLRKLGTDYMDLFLLHWPVPVKYKDDWARMNAESWRAMEDAQQAGKIRSLGISNFRKKHIDALLKTAKILPQVNQLRLCPGDKQEDTVNYSREKGMLPQAYSPLGTGKLFDVIELQEIAQAYGRTVAQVALRWSLQRGYNPLPKSVTPERIQENLQVFDFELRDEDMEKISRLEGVVGYSSDPDTITW